MKKPLQMYSKIGDLKIIQIKRGNTNPIPNGPSPKFPNQKFTSQGFNSRFAELSRVTKGGPDHFIGSLKKKLTTGLITTSKINKSRKDGMFFKFFRFNFQLSQDIGKLSKFPLPYESKFFNNPLLAKKYIKSFKVK
jgi:hypothetical protein